VVTPWKFANAIGTVMGGVMLGYTQKKNGIHLVEEQPLLIGKIA